MNQWYSQQIADLIVVRPKAIPEGAGTARDSAVIQWVNEPGISDTHSHNRVPFAILEPAARYLRTGRPLKAPGRTPRNNLLVSGPTPWA